MAELGSVEISIYLIGNLIRLYIISCLFGVFFNKATTAGTMAIRGIAYTAYYIVNSAGFLYLGFTPNMNLAVNIIGTAAVALTYKGKSRYKLYAVIMSVVMYIICENLIITLILNLNIKDILVIGIIASDMLFYMLVIIVSKAKDIKSGISISIKEWIVIIIVPMLTLFISIVVLGKNDSYTAMAIGEVSLVVVNILVFFMLNRIQSMYAEQLEYSVLEQQKIAYEHQLALSKESEERISSLRHDMKNHFIAIGELAKETDCESIKTYINGLNEELDDTKRIVSTGDTFVESFLNLKLGEAKAKGAEIYTDITISKESFVSPKDMCIIIGNLLDNAISATEKCSGKKLLKVTAKQNIGNIYLCVENSFDNEVHIKDDIFISTKKNRKRHGIGIENVKRVIKNYGGEIFFDLSGDMFTVKIILFENEE